MRASVSLGLTDVVVCPVQQHPVPSYLSVSHRWLQVPGYSVMDLTRLQQDQVLLSGPEILHQRSHGGPRDENKPSQFQIAL